MESITIKHPMHIGQYTPNWKISLDKIYRQNSRPNVATEITSFIFLIKEPIKITMYPTSP